MRSHRRLVYLAGIVLLLGATVAGWYVLRPRPQPDDPSVIKHDPIEDDPVYHAVLEAADKEAREETDRNGSNKLGSVHGFWSRKKEILKEKYGVEWRTPAEMNPKRAFD
jgi:hypothetical protein